MYAKVGLLPDVEARRPAGGRAEGRRRSRTQGLRPPPARRRAVTERPEGPASQSAAGRNRTPTQRRELSRASRFSKPLACPSTLDRRPPVARTVRSSSFVEGLWSPSLGRFGEKSAGKSTRLVASAISSRDAPRVFLSQAGPRFVLELLQVERHLSRSLLRSPPKRRRRPVGSPSRRLDARLDP